MHTLKQHTWSAKTQEGMVFAKQTAQRMLSGETMQQALELPESMLMNFYIYSQELLLENRFEDAEAVLFVISLLCPDRPMVWIGIGSARQSLHQYESARQAYEYASLMDVTLLEPYYLAALCSVSLQDTEAARGYIKALKEHGKPRKEDAHFSLLANRLLQELNNG